MASLTVFANFFINSEERLLRMKDSFMSFKDIKAEKWIINIRGQYKRQAKAYLEEHLGSRLLAFELESPEGWFNDSREMVRLIDSRYVFFWLEDHLNMVADTAKYDEILTEMEFNKVEYLPYSFYWVTRRYARVTKKALKNIFWFDLTRKSFELALDIDSGTYIVGCTGFFSADLFKRIINCDDEKQAIKWPKETPFNFEKSSHDKHWLPIRMGLPQYELFASIDDDSIVPGSCLISRELYPARVPGARITETTVVQPTIYVKQPECQKLLHKLKTWVKKLIS